MSDYIKREDAIKIINSGICIDTDADKRYVNGLFRAIRPAYVAPVRHGRWVEMSYDEYKCSACEKVVREEILYAIKPSDREDASMHIANYCPNCGARMDGEDNEID